MKKSADHSSIRTFFVPLLKLFQQAKFSTNTMKKFLTILTLLSFVASTQGQQKSQRKTLDELIERLLTVNYSLLASENTVEIAKNNVTAAPFLPSLTANARQNQAFGNLSNNSLNAGVQLSWRMFDGGAMFYQYSRSKEALTSTELQFYAKIEDLVGNLIAQYNYIISLKSRVELGEKTLKLSQERYNEALAKYQIGSSSGLDMQLAKTDLNADSSSLINAYQMLDIAYINLAGLLNLDFKDKGYIQDSIKINTIPPYEELRQTIEKQNTQILLSSSGVELSELDLKTAIAARYPTLDFGAAANLGLTNTLPASSWRSANNGSWGFTISANIFNGNEVSRKIRNARLDRKNAELERQNTMNNILTAFNDQYLRYTNSLQLVIFENQNAETMALNLEVAMERYRLGDLSGIDFRTIQLQYLSAIERQISTKYQAKLSEIELMVLSGALL